MLENMDQKNSEYGNSLRRIVECIELNGSICTTWVKKGKQELSVFCFYGKRSALIILPGTLLPRKLKVIIS